MTPKTIFSNLELMQGRVKNIPDGWNFSHLGQTYKIRNSFRLPISEEERSTNPGPYPYYGPTKIQGYIGTFQQDGEFALIGEDGDHFLKYRNNPMTQLVSGKCTINNHAHIIQGTAKASREWFYYYFMHRDIFSFLTRQGAGRYKLNKAALEKLPILVPPVKEQTKITQILSTWDQAIATTKKLIENSTNQKKGLMQQLLTGKTRFREFMQSKENLQTKYGPIPADWSFIALNEVAKDQVERAGEDTSYTVLSCSKYVGFVDSLKYFKKKVYSDDTSNYKVVRRGCFGFPSNHIEEGSIGYQDTYDAGIVSPIYSVFKTNDQVHDSYLYKLLKTDHYRQIFQANTNASVDRRGSLRWKEFGKIHIPLPSVEEQKKIAATITIAEQEISNLTDQLENLNNQKKALMQQLLTGKRRVKVDK